MSEMRFLDIDGEDIEVSGPFVFGELFAIARIVDEAAENCVGLFTEDDGVYHCVEKFHEHWLKDLRDVCGKSIAEGYDDGGEDE